jgi:hypothetical protein
MAQNQNLGNFGRFVEADVVANTASINASVTISKLTVSNVFANGSLGSNGQALTTNGSAVYWSTIVGTNTDAQYVWTNNHTFSNSVVISGNLTVSGTTTTINTATLDVKDLNITVAKGSANGSVSDGAGLTVDGANATWVWNNSLTSWVSNVNITVTGSYISVGNSTINSTVNSTATVSQFGHMNRQTIDYNYTVPSDLNAVIAGPVTVANGFTLTIANGARVAVV